uniref:Uncharacterized protein n=1 Tax=viral metagenome TaxID=1070528 RepID=A0A6C0BFC3_9ZZZZ
MYKIFKDERNNLLFTPCQNVYKKTSFEEKVLLPQLAPPNQIMRYNEWIELHEHNIIDIVDVILEKLRTCYIDNIKLKIDINVFEEEMKKTLYKSSYNKEKKYV